MMILVYHSINGLAVCYDVTLSPPVSVGGIRTFNCGDPSSLGFSCVQTVTQFTSPQLWFNSSIVNISGSHQTHTTIKCSKLSPQIDNRL